MDNDQIADTFHTSVDYEAVWAYLEPRIKLLINSEVGQHVRDCPLQERHLRKEVEERERREHRLRVVAMVVPSVAAIVAALIAIL